ncbi:hypothetical protein CLPU_4c02680 [Gottschalkia purinilytica]|uniref:Uncharacterized protein n=1 Tax=Gottschalkia purinilytica TaxID=1503 RepID=A0A0L0WCM9_GOTPU|nr:hypothetical protein CLPU_4c02680 [Gottschalkia purinilytica]
MIQKQDLSALGFFPIRKRLTQFLIGFLFAGILCALVEILNSKITNLSCINYFVTQNVAVIVLTYLFIKYYLQRECDNI